MKRSFASVAFLVFPAMAGFGQPAAPAKWISGGTEAPESPAPVLCRSFYLEEAPSNAVFNVAVAGWCEVRVNGEKAGRDVLSPVTCQPDMRISSLELDVTHLLKKGENVIEVLLGNGWFNAFTKSAWWFHEAPWVSAPKARGTLTVDGTVLLETDGSWSAYDSPIVFNGLRNGEWYDARLEGVRRNERIPAASKARAAASAAASEEKCRSALFQLNTKKSFDVFRFFGSGRNSISSIFSWPRFSPSIIR